MLRICLNFHQTLLEKTKWYIHTLPWMAAVNFVNKEICKTYILWAIACLHDTPGNNLQPCPKLAALWIVRIRLKVQNCEFSQAQVQDHPQHWNQNKDPSWPSSLFGSWILLRPSTTRVTASPADSRKKYKWSFFCCQYVGTVREPTVDSQEC